MNRDTTLAVAVGGALVIAMGVAIGVAPLTQSATSRALREADRAVEVACRLVYNYDLLAEPQRANVELDPEAVRRVAEQQLDVFQQADEHLQQLLAPSQDVERRHAPLIGAETPPLRIGNTPQQIEANVRSAQEALAAENASTAKLLDEAVRVLDKALAEPEVANHPEALRLRGLIRARQAQAAHSTAEDLRIEADLHRRRLMDLCQQAMLRASEATWLANGVPGESVRQAEQLRSDLGAQAEHLNQRIGELAGIIERLHIEIRSATDAASAAEQRIAELESAGYDLYDPQSFRTWRQQLDEQWTLLRQQEARASRLQFGDLENAELDTRFGGDLVKDRFLPADATRPISYVRGLQSYEEEKARLTEMVAIVNEAIAAMDADVKSWGAGTAEVVGLQPLLQRAAEQAEQQAAALLAEATQAVTRAQELFQQADDQDENADRLFNQAVNDLRKALAGLQQEVSAARARIPADKTNERLEQITDVRDLQAEMQVELGATLMGRVILAAEHLQDLQRHEIALMWAERAQVPDRPTVDFEGMRRAIVETARTAVDQAVEAMNRASGEISNKEYAWTALANEAVAKFLRLQIEANPEDATQALQELDQVVQGRERSPYVRTYESLQQYLRARPAMPSIAGPPAAPPAAPSASEPAVEGTPGQALPSAEVEGPSPDETTQDDEASEAPSTDEDVEDTSAEQGPT